MKANEWLKAELKKEYSDKAEAVYSAIINCRPIQFSSPGAQAKFEAILQEWNRRGEEETEEYDSLAGYGEASTEYNPNRAAELTEFHQKQREEAPPISDEMAWFL